jgi:hypothetical protein
MSDKVFSMGENPKALNIMTDEQRKATEVLDRISTEKEDLSTQELVLDGSNKVSFPGFPFKFLGLGEKILVSIDIFKSGYECKVCKGTKRIKSKCPCEDHQVLAPEDMRPGFRYAKSEIEGFRTTLGEYSAEARAEVKCPICYGGLCLSTSR